MNETIGIIGGFGAAFCASISYIMSRRFTSKPGRSPHQLMALAHVVMAAFSCVIAPFVWEMPDGVIVPLLLPLTGMVGAYFAAQFMLFAILKRYTASNIAPMLGMKLVVAGTISFCLGNPLSLIQISALLLAVAAVLTLRDSKEGVSLPAIGCVLAICVCYAISDFSGAEVTRTLDPARSIRAIVQTVVICYIIAAVYSIASYKEVFKAGRSDWIDAFGYAVTWYVCMFFLFSAFAYIGVVHGVILQSTRSIMAVVIGIVIARMGYSALEAKVSTPMRIRQFAAGIMMVIAVCLYSIK